MHVFQSPHEQHRALLGFGRRPEDDPRAAGQVAGRLRELSVGYDAVGEIRNIVSLDGLVGDVLPSHENALRVDDPAPGLVMTRNVEPHPAGLVIGKGRRIKLRPRPAVELERARLLLARNRITGEGSRPQRRQVRAKVKCAAKEMAVAEGVDEVLTGKVPTNCFNKKDIYK